MASLPTFARRRLSTVAPAGAEVDSSIVTLRYGWQATSSVTIICYGDCQEILRHMLTVFFTMYIMESMAFDPHHLRHLRTERNISQEKLAEEIGISRPTYLQIEKGKRELTVTEAQKLAEVFGMSLDDFLGGIEHPISLPELPSKQKAVEENTAVRINVPQEKMDKFREVLLYILQKIGAKPNVGETVIYKILYFIDFDFYEKFEEQLMGLKYMKNHHGPSPVGFTQMVATMEKDKDLMRVKSKYFQYDQKKYMPLREPDLSKIDARELQHIDTEIARLSDMNAAQIREYSHGDLPWKVHKMGEQLEYECAFYREQPYSMRSYEDDPL